MQPMELVRNFQLGGHKGEIRGKANSAMLVRHDNQTGIYLNYHNKGISEWLNHNLPK